MTIFPFLVEKLEVDYMFKSRIFATRYQARKARCTEPEFNGAEVCVKVCGGYVLMNADDYRVWKNQR